MELRHKLRKIRLERNLTQKQLGELLGLNQSTISRCEWSESMANPHVLRKYAKLLDISVESLLRGK